MAVPEPGTAPAHQAVARCRTTRNPDLNNKLNDERAAPATLDGSCRQARLPVKLLC